MKIILPLILSFGFIFAVYGESENFTVLAKSGLNVRKESSLGSEKVGWLPFGAIVKAEINSQRDYKNHGVYQHYTEIIEGKRGFWVKIQFGKIEGYIFSGFGLVGEWIVSSSEINKDFRLLRTGPYCDAINYDPKLNWYALVHEKGKFSIKKSDVELRIVHEFNDKDTIGPYNEDWRSFPLKVESNLKDSILFLIGSTKTLPEDSIFSEFFGTERGYTYRAKFLYPEESYSIYYKKVGYQFKAFEKVILTNDQPEGFTKEYQIELSLGAYSKIKKHDLSKELELYGTGERHVAYKTPQLVWIGDLDSDGLLDFIYYSHSMTESCGVCWEYHLFMSDKANQDRPVRKVANEISCNCLT